MNACFLADSNLPFCHGCGHKLVVKRVNQALMESQWQPTDIVLVTDIGCHGIIDTNFQTHTVHGLHGRSVALATGISLGLANPKKKVIAFIGDGGATIGMQHILEAAHKNVNLTVVLFNNMLYGMTGGQPSGLTPKGFGTIIFPSGLNQTGYDFCALAEAAGAGFVERVSGQTDYVAHLSRALHKPGFSLLEVMELCTSYAPKFNKGLTLEKTIEAAGISLKVYCDREVEAWQPAAPALKSSLLNDLTVIAPAYIAGLTGSFSLILSGSAGQAVQSAGELLAEAAIASGLHAIKKGSYPVTVGVGFSTAEVIVSTEPIHNTSVTDPDAFLIISADGLNHCLAKMKNARQARLYLDDSLTPPVFSGPILARPFTQKAGAKAAMLAAIVQLLKTENLFPAAAFISAVKASKFGEKLNLAFLAEGV